MIKISIKNKKGFTLVELMIVISLIAFLALIATSYFRTQIFKANDSKRKAELKRIGQALEEYEKDFSCYPTTINNLQPYIEAVPQDAVTKSPYGYEHDSTTACPKWYKLYSVLQNTKDPTYQESIGPGGNFNFSFESPNSP